MAERLEKREKLTAGGREVGEERKTDSVITLFISFKNKRQDSIKDSFIQIS